MEIDFLVPQVSVQETFIVEGFGNTILQDLEQSLVFIPLIFPDLDEDPDEDEVLQAALQGTFADADDRFDVEQTLEQIAPQFAIFGENEDRDFANLAAELFEDGALAATQLGVQTVDILGDANTVFQENQQLVADLLLFEGEEESGDLEDFLERAAGDLLLDSLQFALQDIIVTGNENDVEQTIDQTIAAFVFLDEDEIENNANLAQFSIQETFLGDGTTITDDNFVTQEITQSITVDLTFSDGPDGFVIPTVSDNRIDLPEFDIDAFVGELLGDEILLTGPQSSFQDAFITGNDNLVVQEDVQESIETVPLEIVTGGPGADTLLAGLNASFDGARDLIFTGAQQDRVVTRSPALMRASVPSAATVFGGSGADELVAGGSDRLFGGSGNDTLQAAESLGRNHLYGGAGADRFFLSSGDRAFGGTGSDRFIVGAGGNNTLTGGPGADEFRVATGVLPAAANTITDFDASEDRIGILGLGASLADLSRVGEAIRFEDTTLAILSGIDTAALDASVFVFAA